VLGRDGPLGFSSNVSIDDATERRIAVRSTTGGVDLQLTLSVDETVRTTMAMMSLNRPSADDVSFSLAAFTVSQGKSPGARSISLLAVRLRRSKPQ